MKVVALPILLLPFTLLATERNFETGARGSGMANATVTLSDVFAMYSNQGCLAEIEYFSIGMSTKRHFLLSEIGAYSMVIALPTRSGVLGLSINYFGNKYYKEQSVFVGFGKKLSPKLSIGIMIDYLSFFTEGYGFAHLATFETGVLAKIDKKLRFGAHVFNPIRRKIGSETKEILPVVMNIGMGYSPSEIVTLVFEVEKDMEQKAMLKVGVEYRIAKMLFVRGGYTLYPQRVSFGIGLRKKNLLIDAATTFHPVLGYTPSLSLTNVFER